MLQQYYKPWPASLRARSVSFRYIYSGMASHGNAGMPGRRCMKKVHLLTAACRLTRPCGNGRLQTLAAQCRRRVAAMRRGFCMLLAAHQFSIVRCAHRAIKPIMRNKPSPNIAWHRQRYAQYARSRLSPSIAGNVKRQWHEHEAVLPAKASIVLAGMAMWREISNMRRSEIIGIDAWHGAKS